MATYTVTSPLVIAKTENGTFVHVYEGGVLPDDIDTDQLKQLEDAEMVVKGGSAPKAASADDDDDKRPAGNAGLEEWQAYARSTGMADDEIDGLSRNELRDRFA